MVATQEVAVSLRTTKWIACVPGLSQDQSAVNPP